MSTFLRQQQAEGILAGKGAVWSYAGEGPHAVEQLTSLHTNWYFNSNQIVADDDGLNEIVAAWFAPEACVGGKVSAVLSYAPFGSRICEAVARAIDVPPFLAVDGMLPELGNRAFQGEAVLVCDDVHSGRQIVQVYRRAVEFGLTVRPVIYCMVNCSGKTELSNLKVVSIISHTPERWTAFECPLCKRNSKAVHARTQWAELVSAPA